MLIKHLAGRPPDDDVDVAWKGDALRRPVALDKLEELKGGGGRRAVSGRIREEKSLGEGIHPSAHGPHLVLAVGEVVVGHPRVVAGGVTHPAHKKLELHLGGQRVGDAKEGAGKGNDSRAVEAGTFQLAKNFEFFPTKLSESGEKVIRYVHTKSDLNDFAHFVNPTTPH